MGKFAFFCGTILLVLMLWTLSHHGTEAPSTAPHNQMRIVSLAPAITETLFALGLAEQVVGVTQFCEWPPEASRKAKVGGFREVNLEAIARTKADMVILPRDMAHFKQSVEDLGIRVMLFDYSSLTSFLRDVRALGKATGREEKALALADSFERAMKTKNAQNRPKILFVILAPDECERPVTEMTIIGSDAFYNELIGAAGGQNAYAGATPFPRISLEALISINPDIIVIGAPGVRDTARLEKRWREIGHLQGVKGNRLVILNDAGDTIPGPRALDTLKKIEKAILSMNSGGNT